MFPSGTPWLDHPVLLHSSRASTCDLTAEQCAYKTGYWRNWYQSDHVYALSTVWFIIATVGLFVALHFLGYAPRTVKETRAVQKLVSMSRYLAYRDFYISALSTRTPSIGVMLLGGVGMVFFFGMSVDASNTTNPTDEVK